MSKKIFRALKELTNEELDLKIKESVSSLFAMKLDKQLSKYVSSANFWKTRKAIAMVKTIQTERSRG